MSKNQVLRTIFLIAVLGVFGVWSAFGIWGCNVGSTSGSSGDDDSSDSDSGDDGSSSEEFTISGDLDSLTVSGLNLKGEATSGTVTDVVAVSPATSNSACETIPVESDGTFELPVTGGKPWFLFFLDSTLSGIDMFLGRWTGDTLDTLVPAAETGSIDLETVTVDGASATATSSKDYAGIISDLGIEAATAGAIGAVDDIARRYSNPDVDANGEMDCGEGDKNFMLDFHVRFDMQVNGVKATIANLIDQFLDEQSATVSYNSTGVYVAYPQTFSSATTGSFTFSDSAVTTDEGGAIAAGTVSSAVTSLDPFFGNNGFGPNIKNTSELPSGELVFSVGGETLTFSDVQVPTLAQLTAPTGRIFPFIRFIKSNTSCTSNCTLSGIGYKWVKKTSTGWESPTLAEIDLLVADEPGFGFRYALETNSDKMIMFHTPKDALTGTVTWDPTDTTHFTLSGVTAAQFNALVTSQICHIGLSHDDKLGMKYFQNIDNVAGTCS